MFVDPVVQAALPDAAPDPVVQQVSYIYPVAAASPAVLGALNYAAPFVVEGTPANFGVANNAYSYASVGAGAPAVFGADNYAPNYATALAVEGPPMNFGVANNAYNYDVPL